MCLDSSSSIEDNSRSVHSGLLDTPEKPLSKKKKKREGIASNRKELSAKHDMTFQEIATIETTTVNTAKQIENLSDTVRQLVINVNAQK